MSSLTSPEISSPNKSRCRTAWTVVWSAFIILDLLHLVVFSGLLSFDADRFWITPMMPDRDHRTACDDNYVCQGLRALISFYAFSSLSIGVWMIYTFVRHSHMRHFVRKFILIWRVTHLIAYLRIAHLNQLYWENIMIHTIVAAVLCFLHGFVAAVEADLAPLPSQPGQVPKLKDE